AIHSGHDDDPLRSLEKSEQLATRFPLTAAGMTEVGKHQCTEVFAEKRRKGGRAKAQISNDSSKYLQLSRKLGFAIIICSMGNMHFQKEQDCKVTMEDVMWPDVQSCKLLRPAQSQRHNFKEKAC
ncbi:Hypothetical predicted protein, partial [Podarcis lilfordi]